MTNAPKCPKSRPQGTLVHPSEVLKHGGGFLTEVAVRSKGPERWILLEPLTYEGARDLFTVPAGFHTDFASVPRFARSIVSETGLHTRAAVLHDYLCELDGFPRVDADGIFRRTLREAGVGPVLRWLMWAAVRYGGGQEGASLKEWMQWLAIALAFFGILLALASVIGVGIVHLIFHPLGG